MDNDALREERDRLLDENAKMRVNGPASGKEGDASTVRYLRSKVSQLKLALTLIFAFFRSITLRRRWSDWRKRGPS